MLVGMAVDHGVRVLKELQTTDMEITAERSSSLALQVSVSMTTSNSRNTSVG